jgi:hypothetical protein
MISIKTAEAINGQVSQRISTRLHGEAESRAIPPWLLNALFDYAIMN